MLISWAAASHPGLRRSTNEDSYSARPDLGLFVVADGMGGHAAGEVASHAAVEAIQASVRLSAVTEEPTAEGVPVPADPERDTSRLEAGFRAANRRLADLVAGDPSLRGMATTASAVLVADQEAVVAHVGDSRVYRLRGGALEQMTQDHSWVEEQVRAGTMSELAAQRHPWRNVVTRALSGGEDPKVDVFRLPLASRDRLLLCSDGLSAVLGDEGIQRLVGLAGPLHRVCHELVEAANRGGGPDNVTVLVLELDAA